MSGPRAGTHGLDVADSVEKVNLTRCRGQLQAGATLRDMRRWMIWALLALLWGLQGIFAAWHHAPRQAFFHVVIALFFGFIGLIVHRRDPSR